MGETEFFHFAIQNFANKNKQGKTNKTVDNNK